MFGSKEVEVPKWGSWMRPVSLAVAAGALLLALPALAFAHLERPSYWPDPAPDNTVNPPAGGALPTARPFASLVTGDGPGRRPRRLQGQATAPRRWRPSRPP